MSASNGVVRIGRKGKKKFAFGEEGAPFEVDVVVAFQGWVIIDEGFRPAEENADGGRPIPAAEMPAYQQAAVAFVEGLNLDPATGEPRASLTVAEALDFLARLREEYEALATFFRPNLRRERDSPATSEGRSALRFSEEPAS